MIFVLILLIIIHLFKIILLLIEIHYKIIQINTNILLLFLKTNFNNIVFKSIIIIEIMNKNIIISIENNSFNKKKMNIV